MWTEMTGDHRRTQLDKHRTNYSQSKDILFLTETDIKINKEKDYKIEGFQTVFQARDSEHDTIRILALINNKVSKHISAKHKHKRRGQFHKLLQQSFIACSEMSSFK